MKYNSTLDKPNPFKIHGGQYKAANVSDATAGRVIIDPKKTLSEMSNPAGRTSYVAGCKTASTKAT